MYFHPPNRYPSIETYFNAPPFAIRRQFNSHPAKIINTSFPLSVLAYSAMQEEAKPLLARRRLGDESNQPSSHNLIDRNRHDEEEDDEEGVVTDYGSAVYRYPPYLQPGHFTSLEKLMFFTSSILLILLCVFVGLYARSSQQSPVYTPSPRIPKNHTKKQVHTHPLIIVV